MSARVAALYRYAVKSMGGCDLPQLRVGPAGIPGDRGWALRLASTGKPASAKVHAGLLLCRARFLSEPEPGEPVPPAEVDLPDGTRTRTDDPGAGALLSRFLGVEAAFSREEGGAGHFDARPLHLLTTATLAGMAAKTGLDFDVRRFRPNVLIALDAAGRPEDAWVGAEIEVGSVRVRVLKAVRRCAMTTLPQPGLGAAKGTFPAVFAEGGALGVYGEALASGAWRRGDPVSAGPRSAG